MRKVYLYPEARLRFPRLAAQSVASLDHAVLGRYRKCRYGLIWTGNESLPTYRYPVPYPMHNQGWRPEYSGDGEPVVHVRIQGSRWMLGLRRGRQYRRQLAGFGELVNGDAIRGELSLYRRRASSGDHRSGVLERDAGGQKTATRVLCKMVAWFPRSAKPVLAGNLLVVAGEDDALLAACRRGRERVWMLHADHAWRWIAEYRARLQRWADDQKGGSRRPRFESRRKASTAKFQRRMDSLVHEASTKLANYAARQRVAVVRYDDHEPTRAHFPWHELRKRIRYKLDDRGIRMELVSTDSDEADDREVPDHSQSDPGE